MRYFTIMCTKSFLTLLVFSNIYFQSGVAQELLTIDRIFNSNEFQQERMAPIQWINNGEAYITLEPAADGNGQDMVVYHTASQQRAIFVSHKQLIPSGSRTAILIESFSLSSDETKILIFNESKRVWRSNTKGDFWVFDLDNEKLTKLGKGLPESSLMFAKFSADNKKVAYVSDFNLYVEDFQTGKITQLTKDGSDHLINGTFDWVYEEEFGCRDGFRWNPNGKQIAYWQLDASKIGTFYMMNNLDSVYSQPIPLQYPKVGQDPSPTRVGLVDVNSGKTKWIPVPGSSVQNYIPRMQWIDADQLLIQQLNRKQNHLKVYIYQPSSDQIRVVYEEKEDTWVDIGYPDVTAIAWGMNDLVLVDDNKAFIKMIELDGWRRIIKVDIESGNQQVLTKENYDVASLYGNSKSMAYFSASPGNSTQRYLYQVPLKGGKAKRVTPENYSGVNRYTIAPDGQFAIHQHSNIKTPSTTHLVQLPTHKTIQSFVKNEAFSKELESIELPEESFFKVTTADGLEVDGLMIKPTNFDPSKKYPVLFHVYGEPWGQMALDRWGSLYDKMIAQKGYFVIKLDNRGTPCLKGKEWRKSIYRKIGVLNSSDQAQAAQATLKKFPYIDADRVAVWGWSGGGSMTLNLLFRYPEIYKTGMSVAPVANQLFYDNIYQERYMGLPQENMEDFIEGSPITYAKNLKGNLLLVHGTGDDNVHYQNSEVLINELVAQNKQFQVMMYPNRSHSIREGTNTTRHLYTMLSNYLTAMVPSGGIVTKP